MIPPKISGVANVPVQTTRNQLMVFLDGYFSAVQFA